MDHNQIILAGHVEYHKERRVKGYNFGSISCRIGLPKFDFDFRDTYHDIQKPSLWLSVSVNYEVDSLVTKDKALLNLLDQRKYVFIKDSKITNWMKKPKEDGKEIVGAQPEMQFSLETYSHHVSLSEKPYPRINYCTFTGLVDAADSNGKIKLRTAYRAGKGKEVKHRYIPVINPGQFDPALKGRRVLVTGSICGVTPNRENNLYVVANNIVML
jgi:hypothetical protein